MKCYLREEEWWPVYTVESAEDGYIDIPDEVVTRYEKLYAEWDALQNELRAIRKAYLAARSASPTQS